LTKYRQNVIITRFGHAGVCKFTHPDDPEVKLRPWTDPDEMDEEMILHSKVCQQDCE
jgi:uncharacterized Fe-S cluster protein YjdI